MNYRLFYSEKSIKQLKKMDPSAKKLITGYFRKLVEIDEPRARGKALSSNLKGFWRYRIGDYRAICEIDDDQVIIIVVEVAHRREIYQ